MIATIIMLILILIATKNLVTYACYTKITDGIFIHNMIRIHEHRFSEIIEYDDMEPYLKTLFRLWDWGYKRILPKEKFELIKPYLKKVKKKR